MAFYDKEKIREALELNDIYKLVDFLGGEPVHTSFGFVAKTICHNHEGEGSDKLYYYENSKMFNCYTNCGSMDIFGFVTSVQAVRTEEEMTFYQSMDYVARFFNLEGVEGDKAGFKLPIYSDLQIMANYKTLTDKKEEIEIEYRIYDGSVLNNLAFVPPGNWLKEGIAIDTMKKYGIKYYGTEHKVVIPHYNLVGDLIGIRSRALVTQDVEMYGKYMPIKIGSTMYSHPLSHNLYGLNLNLETINKLKKIIIFEGEKSVLHYESMFGEGNNISVATCGSSLSLIHQEIIKKFCDVDEIIIAYDKEFQLIGDKDFKKNVEFIKRMADKMKNYVTVSVLFDKDGKLEYKDAPIDKGKDTFEYLYKNRIFL